jgi:hypothetical protein
MISFETIINEKDKSKRDILIKEKLDELNASCSDLDIRTKHIVAGFISKNSKVHFSDFHTDIELGLFSIYGMKAEDYFYEFFDFLSEHNITTKQDAVRFISSFLKQYFGEQGIKKYTREMLYDDIHKQLIAMADDTERFKKCSEDWQDIGVFKNMSAAECSEFACVAQNLLTFCDIDSCYITGHIKSKDMEEDHAYNMFKLDGEYYLFDPSNPYNLFDNNCNYVGCKSYFFRINKEKLNDFLQNQFAFNFPKYNFMKKEDGSLIQVQKDIFSYTTTGKFLNKDELNEFFDTNNKTLT